MELGFNGFRVEAGSKGVQLRFGGVSRCGDSCLGVTRVGGVQAGLGYGWASRNPDLKSQNPSAPKTPKPSPQSYMHPWTPFYPHGASWKPYGALPKASADAPPPSDDEEADISPTAARPGSSLCVRMVKKSLPYTS